jgi:hypothetical protein
MHSSTQCQLALAHAAAPYQQGVRERAASAVAPARHKPQRRASQSGLPGTVSVRVRRILTPLAPTAHLLRDRRSRAPGVRPS